MENKCVKCLKDKLTGECYNIKDETARNSIKALEETIKNGVGSKFYKHRILLNGSTFGGYEIISTSKTVITGIYDLSDAINKSILTYDVTGGRKILLSQVTGTSLYLGSIAFGTGVFNINTSTQTINSINDTVTAI